MKNSNKKKDVMIRCRIDGLMDDKINKICEEIEYSRSDFYRRCLDLYISTMERSLDADAIIFNRG
jgi:hypothetical protein